MRGPATGKPATRTVQSHANQRCTQSGTTQTNGMRGPATHKKARANRRIERNSYWRFFMSMYPDVEDQKSRKPNNSSITRAPQAHRSHAQIRCHTMHPASRARAETRSYGELHEPGTYRQVTMRGISLVTMCRVHTCRRLCGKLGGPHTRRRPIR